MNETMAIIITIATACGACGAFGAGVMKYLNKDGQESVSEDSLQDSSSSSSSSSDDNIGSEHTIEDIIHELAQRNSDTEVDIRISIHTDRHQSIEHD